MVTEITPGEFLARRSAGEAITLLDVREAWELQVAPAPTPFVHIPMGQVAERVAELDPATEIVVLCRSGGRSMQVARFLDQRAYRSVANLTGGILAWSRDIDPAIPTY